jgi:hypothetical protein
MEPSQRDDRRSFVAETRFSGAIVSCLWPRDLVAPVLPAGLRLDPPSSIPGGRHPVVFIFGEHERSRVFFASLALETGVRFLEFIVAIPYVRATHGEDHAMFLPRVFSGEPVVTWSGNAHYGYSKRMVPMEWLGDTFVVMDDDGSLLAHANVEGVGRWGSVKGGALAPLAPALTLPKLRVLGFLADGSLMTSFFEWSFEDAGTRPVRARVSIDADRVMGLRPHAAYGPASRCVAVRTMTWRLSWPERFAPLSTATHEVRYQGT